MLFLKEKKQFKNSFKQHPYMHKGVSKTEKLNISWKKLRNLNQLKTDGLVFLY